MSSNMKRKSPAAAWVPSAPLPVQRRKAFPKCGIRAAANAPNIAIVAKATKTMPASESDESVSLDEEAKQWADTAVQAQLTLLRGGKAPAAQLVAFLSVKGVATGENVWESARLLARTRKYLDDERAARLRKGVGWDELSHKSRASMLHNFCNSEGDATYIDPATGYTVFSAFGHLRRGNCCGVRHPDGKLERIHRCRHCPYDHDGNLKSSKWQSLSRRIDVIEYVRENVQRQLAMPTEVNVKNPLFGDIEPGAHIDGLNHIGISQDGTEAVTEKKAVGTEVECENCEDRKVTQCTRCSGWRILISPEAMLCPQCDAKGHHPCISCTGWRPPSIKSFGG